MRRLVNSLGLTAAVFLLILIAGGAVFSAAEGTSLWDGLWWATVTASTVGYGDLYPVTAIGRITGVFLSYTVILFLAPVIVYHILSSLVVDRDKFRHEEQHELMERTRDIDHALEVIATHLSPELGKKVAEILDTEVCEVEY